MKFATKTRLLFSAAVLLTSFATGPLSAQENNKYNYPFNTVKLVTHSKPGAGADIFLRKISKYLKKEMGINFVIDYWSGGSGAKAMAMLSKAPADGSVYYTTTPTHITTSLLSKPAATYHDIDYVVNFFFDPEVIFSRTDSPFSTMKEAVEWSKKNPGKAKWGGSAPGSLERQILERINAHTDAKATVIPHDDGGGLLISVLNKTVDVGVGELQELKSHIEAGTLKVIGTYYRERLPNLPNVPTALEMQLDDQVIRKFRGLAGPKGIPPEVISKIEVASQKVLKDPEFIKEYEADSLVAGYMGQKEYREFMKEFAKQQAEFLRSFNVTSD